jgi:hypothetical protein
MKTEYQLQKVWMLHSLNWKGLKTVQGESIVVLYPGDWNTGQGPDFTNAHLLIDRIHWYGHVEMHLKTSSWFSHAHEADPNYRNVILHVVWKHDDNRFNNCAVLELEKFKLFDDYPIEYTQNTIQLACAGKVKQNIGQYDAYLANWGNRRFEKKMKRIFELINYYKGDLEQVLWILVARSFGQTVNADTFEEIASSIPYHFLKQNYYDPEMILIILLGQGGLIETVEGLSQLESKRRYASYQFDYQLKPVFGRLFSLRMRPANFPKTRLSQLAMLVSQNHDLIDLFLSPTEYESFIKKIKLDAGSGLLKTLYVNVLIPFQLCASSILGKSMSDISYNEGLCEIGPEDSTVMKLFVRAGIKPRHAWDSQSLLELYQQKCQTLNCSGCPFDNR